MTSAMLSAAFSPHLASASLASRPAKLTSASSSIKVSPWRLASSSAAPLSLAPLVAPRRSRTLVAWAAEDDKVRNRGGEDND